jgi:hypothetical protein
MHRVVIGVVFATHSLFLPTLGLAYGAADGPKAALTKPIAALKVAKSRLKTLESLKKGRKDKGGG